MKLMWYGYYKAHMPASHPWSLNFHSRIFSDSRIFLYILQYNLKHTNMPRNFFILGYSCIFSLLVPGGNPPLWGGAPDQRHLEKSRSLSAGPRLVNDGANVLYDKNSAEKTMHIPVSRCPAGADQRIDKRMAECCWDGGRCSAWRRPMAGTRSSRALPRRQAYSKVLQKIFYGIGLLNQGVARIFS